MLYEQMGKSEQAERAARSALQQNPNDQEMQRLLERVTAR
jgi:hypothetical protein